MINIIILTTSIIAISYDKIKSTIKFTNSQFTRMKILVCGHFECNLPTGLQCISTILAYALIFQICLCHEHRLCLLEDYIDSTTLIIHGIHRHLCHLIVMMHTYTFSNIGSNQFIHKREQQHQKLLCVISSWLPRSSTLTHVTWHMPFSYGHPISPCIITVQQ